MEYLQQRNKVQKVEGKLQDAKADRQRQKGERELQRALADLRSKLIELNVTIRHLAIRAPEAGVVFELKPRARCFIALTSEPVMKVVPFDRPGPGWKFQAGRSASLRRASRATSASTPCRPVISGYCRTSEPM
jgi:hypothetical protein